MTTTADHTIPDASPIVLEKTIVRSFKTPIILTVVTVLSIVLYNGAARWHAPAARACRAAR